MFTLRISPRIRSVFSKWPEAGCSYLQQASLSTTQPKSSNKVYELRTYCVYPQYVKPFVELSTQWMHLRTGHSKLVGYWIAELGTGINDMVHIWEYDSLAQRAEVRKKLAGDPEWVGNYFSKILPWLHRQENTVMKCIPGTDVTYPRENGVYDLQQFQTENGAAETAAILQSVDRAGAQMLGCWQGSLSLPNLGWMLWYHKNMDNIISNPVDLPTTSGVRVTESKVLLPTPWSTMK